MEASKVKVSILQYCQLFWQKQYARRLKEVKIDKLKWFSSEIQDDTSLK
jgi:hypothetical protein